ncbi:hypothetical protein H8356DRAFT_1312905 [Neocallimastix lanati (nom. inval.)]|nr:hypothetical protein H8356DRAFT_1312905 [Neocallimastix sp. JGI-2020a]
MSNKNVIEKLYEYCQNKNTTISISDLDYIYGITPEGYFNCIVTIGDKKYDKHLKCKSKKEAKNEIAEYVYNSLIRENENKNILNEKVKELLIKNKISLDEINIYDEKGEENKYICLIQCERFKKYNNEGKILFLTPSSKNDLNNKIYKLIEKKISLIKKK